jgi:hypothetical protein
MWQRRLLAWSNLVYLGGMALAGRLHLPYHGKGIIGHMWKMEAPSLLGRTVQHLLGPLCVYNPLTLPRKLFRTCLHLFLLARPIAPTTYWTEGLTPPKRYKIAYHHHFLPCIEMAVHSLRCCTLEKSRCTVSPPWG